MSEQATIPTSVLDALADVREDGRCNMMNRTRVISLCAAFGHPAAVDWLIGNRDRYVEALEAMGEQRKEQNG